MNHTILIDMLSDASRREAGESEQSYMEKVLRASCSSGLHDKLDEPGLCDLLEPEFYACDAEKQSVTLAIAVKPWMLNPKATLHGGMMAAMLDTTMGLLVRYYSARPEVSTVSLSVNYLSPGKLDDRLLVTAQLDKQGRRMAFANGAIAQADGKKIAAATASFML